MPVVTRIDKIEISKIVRSRRKTVALVITPDAKLVVRAPRHVPAGYIEQLVETKHRWITRKISEAQARPRPAFKEFVNGERFYYMGEPYPLRIVEDAKIDLEWNDGFFISREVLPRAREVFTRWYVRAASKVIGERCEHYAQLTGLKPASVRMSNAQKRWGSCGPRGAVRLNWRLIMAPLYVMDYVVVHELVHLVEKNHSQRFWARVSGIFPDHKKASLWLKTNSSLLSV